MFTRLDSEISGVQFENILPYTEEFNTYTYRNFYNGGGVSLGDINNDGLVDIFFTGNIEDNKLFLNKGNLKFEDITESAGVACTGNWCTGSSFVDVNGDGLLDIYICKAGKPEGNHRYNQLFINQGDLTFKDEAKEYGLDVLGLSIHSAFFDYDKDGDLDCYLLNNSIRSVGGFDLKEGLREIPDNEGNKFFRNDDGRFVDVTTEVGIYSSNIGYGLGITLADYNQDDWPDIFISNDFFERDYLYYNNGDGTFSEVVDSLFYSLSMGSMGADAGDLDNDNWPDLMVTEMLPTTLERKLTKAQYETWTKYSANVKSGYHHQYSRNALHRNMKGNKFLEVGRQSGVSATDWSWAALIQDYDNDGLKDLFVSNGIYKDLLDKDYLNFFANNVVYQSKGKSDGNLLTSLIDSMPSHPLENHMYHNEGDLKFSNVSNQWGLDLATYSNGSAYGDLDNDGDLDLVISNVNMPSLIYINQSDSLLSNNYLQINLKGEGLNSEGIGAKIFVETSTTRYYVEKFTSKGFQSSVDGRIHIGIGNEKEINSVSVQWPSGLVSLIEQPKPNQLLTISEKDAKPYPHLSNSISVQLDSKQRNFDFLHNEIDIDLFTRDRLRIEMGGFDGPAIGVGDLDGDTIDDVVIGGGRNQSSCIYLSNSKEKNCELFKATEKSEVVDIILFDSDGDGDTDIYFAHGGKSFSQYSPELNDVLYINDGKGNFEYKSSSFSFPRPIVSGGSAVIDYNRDGLLDVVIGERSKKNIYGLPGDVFLLKNLGNNEFEVELTIEDFGMVTDIATLDLGNNDSAEIVIVSEWGGVSTLSLDNQLGYQVKTIENSNGLWRSIQVKDLNNDGLLDLVCGNVGNNTSYKDKMKLLVNDFDKNGSYEAVVFSEKNEKYFPIHDIDEMFSQLPILKKNFSLYSEFAKSDMDKLFTSDVVEGAMEFEIDLTSSVVYLNTNGSFKKVLLPNELQYSTINAIHFSDGKMYCGGNEYRVKPQFGRYDASTGWEVNYFEEGDSLRFGKAKPLYIDGEIRDIETYQGNILIGINNNQVKILEK